MLFRFLLLILALVCFGGCLGPAMSPAQKTIEKALIGLKSKDLKEKQSFFDVPLSDIKVRSTCKSFIGPGLVSGLSGLKEQKSEPITLRKDLLSQAAFSDLIVVDDFFPLYPSDFSYYFSSLGNFTIEQKLTEARTMVLSSPLDVVDHSFKQDSYFYAPLGYHHQSSFVAYALDFFLLAYNLKAMDIFRQIEGIWHDTEGADEAEEMVVEKVLDEYSFTEFVNFLRQNEMRFYYPDYNSKDEEVRKAGYAFLCQLAFWLSPQEYLRFLKTDTSSEAVHLVNRVFSFLKKEAAVFKAEKSFEAILEHVTHDNLLASIVKDTDLDKLSAASITEEQIKAFEDLGCRLAFGFVPESFFIPSYAHAEYIRVNLEALKERKRIDEQKKAEERARQKTLAARRAAASRTRRKRSDVESVKEEEADTEATSDEESPDDESEEEETVRLSDASQLVTMSFPKMVASRRYLAVPLSATDKKKSLALINKILTINGQRGLAKDPAYLRSVSGDVDIKTQITVIEVIKEENTDRVTFKSDKKEEVEATILQIEQQEKFLPLLNHFYLRVFSNYSLYEKS